MPTSKKVFVGGLHRSGTSIMAEVLKSHPDISGHHIEVRSTDARKMPPCDRAARASPPRSCASPAAPPLTRATPPPSAGDAARARERGAARADGLPARRRARRAGVLCVQPARAHDGGARARDARLARAPRGRVGRALGRVEGRAPREVAVEPAARPLPAGAVARLPLRLHRPPPARPRVRVGGVGHRPRRQGRAGARRRRRLCRALAPRPRAAQGARARNSARNNSARNSGARAIRRRAPRPLADPRASPRRPTCRTCAT